MSQLPTGSRPEPAHDYLSTACWHDRHPECRQSCKFCAMPCGCQCHRPTTDSEESTE